MFTAHCSYLLVNCPRDSLLHDNVLNVFKAITPTDCQFVSIKLYAIDSRKKKSTCRWKVLYVLKDSEANIYRQGQQARELKEEIMRCHLNNLYGWLITWTVHCHHTPNFHKIVNIRSQYSKSFQWLHIWKSKMCTYVLYDA